MVRSRFAVDRHARPFRQRPAHSDVQRRRAGDARSRGRLSARSEREVFGAEEVCELAEKRQSIAVGELVPPCDLYGLGRVDRLEHDPAVGPRNDLGVRAQADGGVERLGVFVKQIQRPDVESAAGQIDARGGGAANLRHAWARSSSTGTRTVWRTLSTVVPCTISERKRWPCVDIAIRSTRSSAAMRMISVAGSPMASREST